MKHEAASMTLSWTSAFVDQLSDREFRHAYMADQVRLQIAFAIRALREQDGRNWSQAELGKRCGKPQSWISKLEDPDYGKVSLQTLFEIAEAFDLPLLVQFPEWAEWMKRTKGQSRKDFEKKSFEPEQLKQSAVISISARTAVPSRVYSNSKYSETGALANAAVARQEIVKMAK